MDFKELLSQSVIAVLLVVIPYLGTLAGALLNNWIKGTKTTLDDRLAGLAVKWAEDSIGKGKGEFKLHQATSKLVDLSGGRIEKSQAELLVRSAYQNIYGQLSPLKND